MQLPTKRMILAFVGIFFVYPFVFIGPFKGMPQNFHNWPLIFIFLMEFR